MEIYSIYKRKKAISVLLASLLFLGSIHAQTTHSRRKENFDVSEFKAAVIDIKPGASILQLSHIQGITIIDARADTSNIGLMQKKVVSGFTKAMNSSARNQTEQRINRTPTFIVLANGLTQSATGFLQRSVVFANSDALPRILMVIKKLWLSDELNLDSNDHVSGKFAGPLAKDVWSSGVDMKAEFYLDYKGDYYAMYRYDSVITKSVTILEYGSQFVQLALQLSIQKMALMDAKTSSILNKRKFSMAEIKSHSEAEFNMPILKDTLLKKGVYMTFDDFKNNNPSQTDFELRKEKITDILYIKQPGGTDIIARDAWGYSDGKYAFIRSADNFFLLQRNANAFYVYGAKNIKRTESTNNGGPAAYTSNGSGYYVPATVFNSSKTALELEPFQLDWSTGKLY